MKRLTFTSKSHPTAHPFREGARAVVVKDGRVLLSYFTKRDQYLIPGGSMHADETPEKGAVRETLEECGYHIRASQPFLVIDEYYQKRCWRNWYCRAEVTEKGEKDPDLFEKYLGLEERWLSFEELSSRLLIPPVIQDKGLFQRSGAVTLVKNSHFRELCAISVALGKTVPPVPEFLDLQIH